MRARKLAAATLVAGAVGGIGTLALADRDRPGTPNRVVLSNCSENAHKPSVCGELSNTASEKIHIEMEMRRNGRPDNVSGHSMGCTSSRPINWCLQLSYAYEGKTGSHLDGNPIPPLEFKLHNMEYNARYCVRFRARRVSDQIVSAKWSSWACADTGNPPGRPGAPALTVKFLGTQWLPGPPRKKIPEKIALSWPPVRDAGTYDLTIYDARDRVDLSPKPIYANSVKPQEGVMRDDYTINPAVTRLRVVACGHGLAGKSCTARLINAETQTVSSVALQSILKGKDVHVKGKRPTTPVKVNP